MTRIDEIKARLAAATPGPWHSIILPVRENAPQTDAVAYVESCIAKGGRDFHIVVAQKPDGPADVCHAGNGPTSVANSALIAHAGGTEGDLAWLVARVEALETALRPLVEWLDPNQLGNFESLAAHFHAETGLMAPGKDDRCGGNVEERRRAWCNWIAAKRHAMFERAGTALKGPPC